jgi:hypothetical protein
MTIKDLFFLFLDKAGLQLLLVFLLIFILKAIFKFRKGGY